MKKILMSLVAASLMFSGCSNDADVVSRNLSQEAR